MYNNDCLYNNYLCTSNYVGSMLSDWLHKRFALLRWGGCGMEYGWDKLYRTRLPERDAVVDKIRR